MARHRWTAATPVLAGLLGVPFVLTQNSWFEWANALWLLQLQTASVKTNGLPSFFVNAPEQVFYPVHLFYAGPLFSVLAYPGVLFGAWPVFAAITILAFVGLATGMYWMARALGVPGLYAAAPALLLATTPYVVSDLYGRGAWTELVSLSGLSLVLGSTTALLAGGPRPRAAFAVLIASSFVLAGTHNITLLWSVVIGLPLLVVVVLALGVERHNLLRRALVALSAVALGTCLCACFLVPNLALSNDTLAAQKQEELSRLRQLSGFETPTIVFSPILSQPKTAPTDLHTQTATVALLWTAIVAIGCRRRLGRRALTLVATLALLATAVAVFIVEPPWWAHLPSLFWATQFTLRLVPYLTLCLLLAMVLVLRVAAVRHSRWATAGLVVAVGWQAGLGGYQSVAAEGRSIPPYPPITAADVTASRVPDSFGGTGFFQPTQFRLVSGHRVDETNGVARARVERTRPPTELHIGGDDPAGSLISTNVVFSPLIMVHGDARLAGRDAVGLVVLSVTEHSPAGWQATVSGACPLCIGENRRLGYLPVQVGEALTVLALAALVFISARAAMRPLRKSRRPVCVGAAECSPHDNVLDH